MISKRSLGRITLGEAGGERVAPHLLETIGHEVDRLPDVGHLRGELDVLRADRGERDRDVLGRRAVHEPDRLAQPRATLGERQVVGDAVVLDLVAAPHLAADLDRVAGARDRLLEGHAVPALDHLRARRTEPEDEPAIGQRVERRRSLRDQRRAARVERDDARHQLDRRGLAGQVAERRHEVVAVDLRSPDQIDARRLEIAGLRGQLLGVTVESDGRGDLHAERLSCGCLPTVLRRTLRAHRRAMSHTRTYGEVAHRNRVSGLGAVAAPSLEAGDGEGHQHERRGDQRRRADHVGGIRCRRRSRRGTRRRRRRRRRGRSPPTA